MHNKTEHPEVVAQLGSQLWKNPSSNSPQLRKTSSIMQRHRESLRFNPGTNHQSPRSDFQHRAQRFKRPPPELRDPQGTIATYHRRSCGWSSRRRRGRARGRRRATPAAALRPAGRRRRCWWCLRPRPGSRRPPASRRSRSRPSLPFGPGRPSLSSRSVRGQPDG